MAAFLLIACTPTVEVVVVTPTAVPSATPTPRPTLTPSPTPTPTPVPPVAVSMVWPGKVSGLEPVPVEVDVAPPSGFEPPEEVRVSVLDPEAETYAEFALSPKVGNRYAADYPLNLPFEPQPGHWWLFVHVETDLGVTGDRVLAFEPAPIPSRTLTNTLRPGVAMRVPLAFGEIAVEGDVWAGRRVWEHNDGQLALWWAPGPTEPLLYSNALVMIEATYDEEDNVPTITESHEVAWQGQPAFRFHEDWTGYRAGQAIAWVIQGPDHWLYVLRVRGLGRTTVPLLHQQVAVTFSVLGP